MRRQKKAPGTATKRNEMLISRESLRRKCGRSGVELDPSGLALHLKARLMTWSAYLSRVSELMLM
jgi:hypothetical protein